MDEKLGRLCIVGLSDHTKPGRLPKMSAKEEEQALKIILESLQQIKVAIPKIDAQLGPGALAPRMVSWHADAAASVVENDTKGMSPLV
jgi:hypothetical protein